MTNKPDHRFLLPMLVGSGSLFFLATVSAQENGDATLEEVVVSAQKREELKRRELIQNEAIAATVLSASSLMDSNQLRLQDFYARVPGLNFGGKQSAFNVVSIRGITASDYTNPRVGILIDEAPFGPTLELGGGLTQPDIDPNDLATIEILKGPQGTFYGANTLGGLIKYVNREPSLDAFSGRISTGVTSIENGSAPGYNLRGAVNVPLGEELAVTLSGFTRLDPGYVDNPVRDLRGVNESTTSGGRLGALWRPSENFSVKLSALVQDYELFGSSDVHPQLGDLQQDLIQGTGGYEQQARAFSVTADYRIGNALLTSITGYNTTDFAGVPWDDSSWMGASALPEFGVGNIAEEHIYDNRKFTQELRFKTPLGERFDGFVGAFFDDEATDYASHYYVVAPGTGQYIGVYIGQTFPTEYREYAAFSDLTYHVTDRLDIEGGVRRSRIEQSIIYTRYPPYDLPVVGSLPAPDVEYLEGREDVSTYMLTSRYKVTPELMTYARLATGYGPGSFNLRKISPNIPKQYAHEETENYEIGLKGDIFGRLLTFEMALYYTEWQDLQISLRDPVTNEGYTGNAALAKSQGVELSLDARPVAGLSINGSFAYSDAKLKEGFPAGSPIHAVAGDRLPNNSRYTAYLAVDQEFSLWNGATPTLGASMTYVGERLGPYQATPDREVLPDYTTFDLHAGMRFATWTANLFVSNVTDERGMLAGGKGYLTPFARVYILPRTIGLNLSRDF